MSLRFLDKTFGEYWEELSDPESNAATQLGYTQAI